MTPLPQPDDLTSLVLRTDFTDNTAWDALKAALITADPYPNATFVSDAQYAGVSIEALVQADAEADDEDKLTYLFLADATTMADDEHPLLAVDLYDEPGRIFRVPLRWYDEVSANLSIANLDFADFADFADATNESGMFRGFEGD
ncbi:DUF6924 domain-containing protein [Planotetraspora kaengkrachanensis]|uniref:DUF6924 domain-containing protein n=1 Tax=Planotetraspora kaengkrachanensis TaxID=575193 RepID=A0A8J3Q0T9_9ACTN|nr:hypothetical protein [Planotetraspora kaengkrachanensis]GIG84498.1 hypothetical protein Pka01_76250 [Planotetraspora kaengkrachanensis]